MNHPALPGHPDHALYERYFPQGGGSIFTFEIRGGQEEAHRFIDSLEIFSLLANVADVKSLVIHPGDDHPLAAFARGAGRAGDHACHGAPLRRHGACR